MEHIGNMERNSPKRVRFGNGDTKMVYLVASLASMIMLAAGLGLIYLTVRASQARIIGALLGQPVDRRTVVLRDARPRNRVTAPVRRSLQPLRAAA